MGHFASLLFLIWKLVKVVTLPLWGPLWVIKRYIKTFIKLVLITSILNACSHDSSQIDTSPCACEFHRIGDVNHA